MSSPASSHWIKRLAWFVVLWALGVLALGVVAYSLRLFMRFAGLADMGS